MKLGNLPKAVVHAANIPSRPRAATRGPTGTGPSCCWNNRGGRLKPAGNGYGPMEPAVDGWQSGHGSSWEPFPVHPGKRDFKSCPGGGLNPP